MEIAVEEDRDELKDIDEFFNWEWEEDEDEIEDEDKFDDELEQFTEQERPSEPSDYFHDIRNKLKHVLSSVQTHEPR